MSKGKAVFCTILFVIVVALILFLSSFLKNEELGVDLFRTIVYSTSGLWFVNLIDKFYKWLRPE